MSKGTLEPFSPFRNDGVRLGPWLYRPWPNQLCSAWRFWDVTASLTWKAALTPKWLNGHFIILKPEIPGILLSFLHEKCPIKISKNACYPTIKRKNKTNAVKYVFMQRFKGSFSETNLPFLWKQCVAVIFIRHKHRLLQKMLTESVYWDKKYDNLGHFFSKLSNVTKRFIRNNCQKAVFLN